MLFRSSLEPSVWCTLLPSALVMLLVAALWMKRRVEWSRAGLAGTVYFLLMLAPVLGFLNIYFMIYSLVANHWLYFAEVGLVALVTGAVTTWANRRLALVCGVSTLLLLGGMTWQRARLYADPVRLWGDAFDKNPENWVVRNNLGNALMTAGDTNAALTHYQAALRLNPQNERTYYNLGLLYVSSGDLTNAIAAYRQAATLSPKDADTHYNLGLALGRSGQYAQAADQFALTVRLRPGFAEAYHNFGFALTKMGRNAEAVPQFRRAVELLPDWVLARCQLALALARLGNNTEAARQLDTAHRLQPNSAAVREATRQLQPSALNNHER